MNTSTFYDPAVRVTWSDVPLRECKCDIYGNPILGYLNPLILNATDISNLYYSVANSLNKEQRRNLAWVVGFETLNKLIMLTDAMGVRLSRFETNYTSLLGIPLYESEIDNHDPLMLIDLANDTHYRHNAETPSGKECRFCGQVTGRDKRGGCNACGAPL